MVKQKFFNKMLVIIFVIYISIFPISLILVKDKEFSETEKRQLEQFPEISLETIFNKTFGSNFEIYIADQFPLRDKFVSLKSNVEVLMQKKENNGVYIGKDNNLIEVFDDVDLDKVDKISKYINNFQSSFNTYMMVVPTAITINDNKLPNFVNNTIEEKYMNYFIGNLDNGVNNISIIDTLKKHNDEYLYYKTDHHWTTLGAYYAYEEFCNSLGIDSISKDGFDVEEVSNDFYGTLASKGNFSFVKPDTINLFIPKNKVNVLVDYVYSDTIKDSLYEYDYLNTKDKYGIFLDNNHPLVKILSLVDNGKKIAVIKDSYAHSLVPFLSNHYGEIHMIDLRLFKGVVSDYLRENEIKDVLFVYNARNILSDVNLMRLK